MNYYLLFGKFEDGEGSYSVLDPWRSALKYYEPNIKLTKNLPKVTVDKVYDERGVSDYLKIGVGALASLKVQEVFFNNGFTGIQFLPVEIENDGLNHSYAFMNVVAQYDLLEPIKSKAKKLNSKLGGYTRVRKELIDKEKFFHTDIQYDCFTLSNYKVPYYVSEQVKDALEAAGVTGIEFIPMEFA
ncbi:imm11 family protein [Vibrio bivalvicida]|uniref:Immunity MXAN-0049 protein domain-containing protein n=1 Tax=Vibrio bivalvicida TaxID=1276888 RepID=A0A177XWR9_9VIBR|nr:hypothetical protein [Vibrio bivalvicida]OAJ93064.1 hypothetical protein APB76_17870 [Vibrio bivalvicida]